MKREEGQAKFWQTAGAEQEKARKWPVFGGGRQNCRGTEKICKKRRKIASSRPKRAGGRVKKMPKRFAIRRVFVYDEAIYIEKDAFA